MEGGGGPRRTGCRACLLGEWRCRRLGCPSFRDVLLLPHHSQFSPQAPLLFHAARLATAPGEDPPLHSHPLCLPPGLQLCPAALPVPFTLGAVHSAEGQAEAPGWALDRVPSRSLLEPHTEATLCVLSKSQPLPLMGPVSSPVAHHSPFSSPQPCSFSPSLTHRHVMTASPNRLSLPKFVLTGLL